jgi:hypothetical protein
MKREELIAYDRWLTTRKWGGRKIMSPEKAADLYLSEVPPSSATAEEISEDMYVKAEVFLQYKDVWNHPYISDRKNKTGYEVTFLIAEFAAQQVTEAAKDCYPKTFTKWFRSDEFYEIFNEGTDNEGLIQWEYMSSGQILDTLDELLDYWTNNIEQ